MKSNTGVSNNLALLFAIFFLIAGFGHVEAQDVTFTFPEVVTGEPGDQFSVDVITSDLTGLGVFNFDMEISYDSSLLTITTDEISGGDLLDGSVTANVADDERILVNYASSQEIEGGGTLFTISGKLADEGYNSEGLKVAYVLLGDGSLDVSPSVPVDIVVDVKIEPVWEVYPQLIELSGPEAGTAEFGITQTAGNEDLTWELTSNVGWLSFPDGTTGTGSASVAIGIEENTEAAAREGVITIVTNAGNDQVTVIQPGQPGEVVLDFGGTISGMVGDPFAMDVTVSDLTDLGVSNFEMEMSFDSSLLTITDEDIQGGDLLGGPLTVNVTGDERILVGYASSQDLEGSGKLFAISGHWRGPERTLKGLRSKIC